MSRRLAGVGLLLLVWLAPGAGAHTADSANRLVGLIKLWATVKYFHPGLDPGRPEWWDEALLSAVSQVEAASSTAEYAAALDAMLMRLDDSVTRIDDEPPAAPMLPLGFASAELRDGVLVVTSGSVAGDALATIEPVLDRLPRATSVIFDLRRGPVHGWLWDARLLPAAPQPLPLPAHRFRVHAGNVTPRGAADIPFFSGALTRSAPALVLPDRSRHERVVFLVSDSTQVPLFAPALQVAGTGFIVATQPIDDRAIARHAMTTHHHLVVGEGVTARIRTSLMVHRDGTTGLVADRIVTGDAMAAALEAATGTAPHARRPTAPPAYDVRAPEAPYADPSYPSWPHRVLGAARVWSAFEWLNPYRDLMDGDWDGVLKTSLAALRDAGDARAYHLAIAEMVSHVHDTHAVVMSPTLDAFVGSGAPPVTVRPIEGRPVVVRLTDPSASRAGVAVGDVILSVDGVPASERLAVLSRYISASTPQARQRDAVNGLLRGADGSEATVVVETAGGSQRRVRLPRKAAFVANVWQPEGTDAFTRLPSGFGYIDLRLLMPHQVDAAFDALQDTPALILDMRGYPNGTFTAIAGRLTDQPTVTTPLLWVPLTFEPGTVARQEFHPPLRHRPRGQPYRGRTVMLIDERAQSQSEHAALVLRSAHGTVFIGSATAGANGEGSNFPVPGGIFVGMTGIGVSHPDGRQLQRVGILPDVPVAPTIAGVRAGRDEVLERAVDYLRFR